MEHEVGRFWMTKLDAGLVTTLPASDSGSAAVWGSKRINPQPQAPVLFVSDLKWIPFKQQRRRKRQPNDNRYDIRYHDRYNN